MPIATDRRNHTRTQVQRPCKVYCPATHRYLAGETCDLSATGALVRVDSPRPLAVGEEIKVVVAWDRKAVLPAHAMMTGKVVRIAASIGQHQAVAVRFAQEQALAQVA